jgi:hypothetical protein
MKLFDYQVSYMGTEFTVEDIYKFLNDKNSVDVKKVGGLTYLCKSIKKIMLELGDSDDTFKESWVNNFYFRDDELCFDTFISDDNLYKREYLLPLILVYFDYFKIEEVDEDLIFNLAYSESEEEVHENALILAQKYFNQ